MAMQESGSGFGNTELLLLTGTNGTSGSYLRPIAVYTVNRANVFYSSASVTLRSYVSDSTWDWTVASDANDKIDLGTPDNLIQCFSKKSIRKFYFKTDKNKRPVNGYYS